MPTWQQTAQEKLLAPPSRAALLEFIRWLDLAYAEVYATPGQGTNAALPMQILARAVVAAGYALQARPLFSVLYPTLRAAEVYSLEPSEANYDLYFAAATATYPFGPGEGCYAVAELGYPGCEPGSGCTSGAGTLAQLAFELDEATLLHVLRHELLPWLQGQADPVAARVKRRA